MMLTMLFTLVISLGIGYLFYRATSAGLVTSLLATIPGGAAEMATIALTLGCDVTLVAAIQMIRLFTMFMVAPGMTIWLGRRLAARERKGKADDPRHIYSDRWTSPAIAAFSSSVKITLNRGNR